MIHLYPPIEGPCDKIRHMHQLLCEASDKHNFLHFFIVDCPALDLYCNVQCNAMQCGAFVCCICLWHGLSENLKSLPPSVKINVKMFK